MKCFSCRGKVEDCFYTDVTDFETCIIIVRGVPRHKCTECGEITYDFNIGLRIEKIVDTLKDSIQGEIAVVQYSPTEIKVAQYAKTTAA